MKKKNIVTRKKIGISELDINNLKKIKLGNYIRKNNFFDFSKVIVKKPWALNFCYIKTENWLFGYYT